MRIFVHEFITGGGFMGRRIPLSLAREGLAMRTALVADLAALGGHDVVTTTDCRFRREVPAGVAELVINPAKPVPFDSLLESVDAVWLVAPETNRCLERLAMQVERSGKSLLGSTANAIGRASDKARYPLLCTRVGLRHPETVRTSVTDAAVTAKRLGYPVVIKPRRGAGGQGVRLVRDARGLKRALDEVHRIAPGGNSEVLAGRRSVADLLMQRYVRGTPASVSLLANGRKAVALAMNEQRLTISTHVSYRGGCTPFEHPLAEEAVDAAIRACEALPGLRGYVGVDLVLSDDGAVVIEVNPRLTTAYLGVRAALDENVAALAIDACGGILPRQPVLRRRVRFTSSGLVAAA